MADRPECNVNTGGSTTEGHLRAPRQAYLATGASGQIAVMFALSLLAVIPLMGLIFDGGNIYVQRRTAQNAADAASLAGIRALASITYRTTPLPVPDDSAIATAVCTYLIANQFGVAASSGSTAYFVDSTGAQIGQITLPTAPDPTPADASHRKLDCVNPSPALSPVAIPIVASHGPAGVQVNATIGPFPTFIAGFLGRGIAGGDGAGIAQATTSATSTVQGSAPIKAYQASNTPFIICGINTRVSGGPPHSILAMSGGVPVVPAAIDPTAVGMTFIVHGPVADCGVTTGFAGVADMLANAGVSVLPAQLLTSSNIGAGTTQTAVDSFQGCGPVAGGANNANNCTMMLPVATSYDVPAGSGVLQKLPCVLWAPFWIVKTGLNTHTAQLKSGFSVGVSSGPSVPWTWDLASPYVSVELTR